MKDAAWVGVFVQVLIKFMAEADIHVIQHDCVRQRGWCSTWGAAGTGCSLLTGRRTSAAGMTTANDPSHRRTTEQGWSCGLSSFLSASFLSFSAENLGQPVHPATLLSITHWLVWHCHSTCQSLYLNLPTSLSVCLSLNQHMCEWVALRSVLQLLRSWIWMFGQFVAVLMGTRCMRTLV